MNFGDKDLICLKDQTGTVNLFLYGLGLEYSALSCGRHLSAVVWIGVRRISEGLKL
jgi:hypothetical protein